MIVFAQSTISRFSTDFTDGLDGLRCFPIDKYALNCKVSIAGVCVFNSDVVKMIHAVHSGDGVYKKSLVFTQCMRGDYLISILH